MPKLSEALADTFEGTQQRLADLEAEVAYWRDLRLDEAANMLSSPEARDILANFAPAAASPEALLQLIRALRRLDHGL